jgi:hypothetical protein
MLHKVEDETIRALRHVLLKSRDPAEKVREYEKAYAFWLEMWSSTFSEVEPDKTLHSDPFLTLRELSAIFLRDQVVGLMMYDFRDLRVRAHRDLSYIKHYPPEALARLDAQGHYRVMQGGQLTVHPDWRRSKVGTFMSELLVGLSMKRFLASDASVMIAFTRNDRSTQELAYRYGAAPLCTGHTAYGIQSDVIAFYRGQVQESPVPGIQPLVDRLWSTTTVPRSFSNLPPALASDAEHDLKVVWEGDVEQG